MHKTILISILAITLFSQLPVLADSETLTKVMGLASGATDMTGLRGGGKSGKPLGYYRPGADVVFRSGYEKQPAKTMAEFATDLAAFIDTKGGGWDHYVAYKKEQNERKKGQSAADDILNASLGAKPDPYDPRERAHVSYDQQKGFAEKWWKSHDPAFAENAIQKDWWLNDSILDANSMLMRCAALYGTGDVSERADRETWFGIELESLVQKK